MPKAKVIKRNVRFHPYRKEHRDLFKRITSNINKDGYLYCIRVQLEGKNVVKIGKTHMKMNESDDSVITRLSRRYHTYYPTFEMTHFVRVIDVHTAERHLFDMLSDIKLENSNEHFYDIQERIDNAFTEIKSLYPSLEALITRLDPTTLTSLNQHIRYTQ